MRKVPALVIVGIVSVVGVASADAADRPRKYPQARVIQPPPPPPPRIDAVASGWYLRGDLGHRWYSVRDVVAPTGFSSPADHKVGSGWFGGIGAGFKQDRLRVDVTADYGSRVKYTGTVVTPGDVTAKLQAHPVLINAYYEPYSFNGFTPYVGIGAGVAQVRVSDFTSTVVPPLTPVAASRKWNFAYAVMAGSSFAVSRQVLLDVGYRYLGLGTADTTADSSGRVTQFKNIVAHEVRIGVRFVFPDPPNLR